MANGKPLSPPVILDCGAISCTLCITYNREVGVNQQTRLTKTFVCRLAISNTYELSYLPWFK